MIKNILIYSLVLIVAFVSVKSCRDKKAFNNRLNVVDVNLTVYKTKYGREVVQKRAIQISSKNIKRELLRDNDSLKEVIKSFKKITSSVKIITVTRIDTVRITYKDTVPFIFERSFFIRRPQYKIGGVSNHKGVTIDSLMIPNRITFYSRSLKRRLG